MFTVKVKFKLKDKVWCIQDNTIKEFVINKIRITIKGDYTFIRYTNNSYSQNPDFNMKESECFPTRRQH